MTKFSRKSRVSELIKRELAKIIQSFVFNEFSTSVFDLTVTEVYISSDLKNEIVRAHFFLRITRLLFPL